MLRTVFLAALASLAMAGGAQAAETAFYIHGHDSDNPSTTISGGENGGTSTVTAEGGAQYTISFAGMPSPMITVSGVTGTGMTSFYASYDYRVNVVAAIPPIGIACYANTACHDPDIPILTATGRSTIAGDGFSVNTAMYGYNSGGQVAGSYCNSRDDDCHFTEAYSNDLFAQSVGPCSSLCASGFTDFIVPIHLDIQGYMFGGDNGAFTVTIDPVVSLNRDFFTGLGVDPSQVSLVFEPGIGNTAGGAVPEPAVWALMLVGFGGMGAALRRRRAAAPTIEDAVV